MTDTLETINCPACGSLMQKVFVQGGFAIDVCSNGCGGMFFDNQEIQELNTSQFDLEEIKKLMTGKNFMPVDESQIRICPACGTKMAKTRAQGIQIDTCYKCNGIFLDNGEFELVRSNFVKRKKVQQINLNSSNDINIKEFYKDAQDEKFLEDEQYDSIRRIAFAGRRRYGLLDFILSLLS